MLVPGHANPPIDGMLVSISFLRCGNIFNIFFAIWNVLVPGHANPLKWNVGCNMLNTSSDM